MEELDMLRRENKLWFNIKYLNDDHGRIEKENWQVIGIFK